MTCIMLFPRVQTPHGRTDMSLHATNAVAGVAATKCCPKYGVGKIDDCFQDCDAFCHGRGVGGVYGNGCSFFSVDRRAL